MSNSFTIVDIEQGSADWHSMRASHIGASDLSKLMGLSPWGSALSVFEEKMGLSVKEDNHYMKRGRDMEEQARQAFSQEMGRRFEPIVLKSNLYPFAIASLDGISAALDAIVEIKCAGPKDHATALKNEVPLHYFPQLQWQLMVSGLESIYYYSFDGTDGIIVEILRDEKFIQKMLDVAAHFYLEHMQKLVAPAATKKDYVVKDDEKWLNDAKELLEIRKHLKTLEQREEEIYDSLLEQTSEKNCTGGGIVVYRTYPKGRVQYDKVPELIGIDLEPYREKSKARWTIKEGGPE